MDYRSLATIFITVFIAELGDKTQLATMLFASNRDVNKLTVFIGSATALVLSAALGVLAGSFLSEHISQRHLTIAAGMGFIGIGLWTLFRSG